MIGFLSIWFRFAWFVFAWFVRNHTQMLNPLECSTKELMNLFSANFTQVSYVGLSF